MLHSVAQTLSLSVACWPLLQSRDQDGNLVYPTASTISGMVAVDSTLAPMMTYVFYS